MGRGLSDLQRWILIHATDPKLIVHHEPFTIGDQQYSRSWHADEDYYMYGHGDDGERSLDQMRLQRRQNDITTGHILRDYYHFQIRSRGANTQWVKVTPAARVAISVAAKRLMARGLMRYVPWGYALTLEGHAKANALIAEMSADEKTKWESYKRERREKFEAEAQREHEADIRWREDHQRTMRQIKERKAKEEEAGQERWAKFERRIKDSDVELLKPGVKTPTQRATL